MKYQQNLQVRLQERFKRLFKADYNIYPREVQYFVDFVDKTPALRSMVQMIERSLPDLDPAAWVQQHFGHREYDWPDSEIGRAKVAWHLLTRWAEGPEDPKNLAVAVSSERNFNAALRDLTQAVVEPFVEYLQEQLGGECDVLYLLERYKRRVEWFEQERLYEAFEADPSHGEAQYDKDLRRFLFEQGIDYPFSQPASPSGKADVVGGLEADDPLVCEVKLFDDKGRGVPYLSRGLNQAVRYAHDYGKTSAYLAIFNMTERPLHLPSDGAREEWPARLELAGVTVFLVPVQARPLQAASRERVQPRTVAREELVAEVEQPSS